MFDAIEREGLIRAGVSEREVENAIGELAAREFGVEKHWHRRIVRAGPNSVTIAGDNPPVRTIAADDIVYVDLGPVFEAWEADIGKSYVLGEDALKHKLAADLPRLFETVQAHYRKDPGHYRRRALCLCPGRRGEGRLALRRQDRRPYRQ